MRFATALILCFWGLPLLLFGQLNESDTLALQYRAALGGNLQTGNVQSLTLTARLDFSVAPGGRWAFKTQNTSRYQAFFDRKADNDFSSRNFLYAGPQHRVYPFWMAFVSTNFRRKIDFRYFTGPGVTWQVLRRPKQVIKISLSGVYESTDFAGQAYNYPEYDGRENISTWRATARIFGQHTLLPRRLNLYYEAYIQPSLEDAHNFRWMLDSALELPLWKGLSFQVHYQYSREQVVVASVKSDDSILTFGISFRNHP